MVLFYVPNFEYKKKTILDFRLRFKILLDYEC